MRRGCLWVATLTVLLLQLAKTLRADDTDYNVVNDDGSFKFGLTNDDIGGHYHSATGTSDQVVRGRYGSRSPVTNQLEQVSYTAGPRGFRARGANIHRNMDLSQAPRGIASGSSDDPLADPFDDPSYGFRFRTADYQRREDADRLGRVNGLYSYLDDVGERHSVRYAAGAGTGYQVSNAVPDTPSLVKYSAPLYKTNRAARGKVSYERGPGGQYKFIASAPDQRRSESTGADGITRGSYSYLDDKGVQRTVEYIAGAGIGYKIVQSLTGPGTHLSPRPAIPPFGPAVSNDISDAEGSGFKKSESGFTFPRGGGNDASSGGSRGAGNRYGSGGSSSAAGSAGAGYGGGGPTVGGRGGAAGGASNWDKSNNGGSGSGGSGYGGSGYGGSGSSGSGYGGSGGTNSWDKSQSGSRGGNAGGSSESHRSGSGSFGGGGGGGSSSSGSVGNRYGSGSGAFDSKGSSFGVSAGAGSSDRGTGSSRYGGGGGGSSEGHSGSGHGIGGGGSTEFSSANRDHLHSAGGSESSASSSGSRPSESSDFSSGASHSSGSGPIGSGSSAGSGSSRRGPGNRNSYVTSNDASLAIDRNRDWTTNGRDSTIVKNVGKWYVGLPPGAAVRAHVQNIDLLPIGGRPQSPSEALRKDVQRSRNFDEYED